MEHWLESQRDPYDPAAGTHVVYADNVKTPLDRHAIDIALDKLALAVAALYRAGPSPARLSEAFWIFAAGSWSRRHFDTQVRAASTHLPKRTSVDHDVAFAEDMVVEALALLRKQGDIRDAWDLEAALASYREERGLW